MLRASLAHRAPTAGRTRYAGPPEQRRRRLPATGLFPQAT
jgi:hypothetical protein